MPADPISGLLGSFGQQRPGRAPSRYQWRFEHAKLDNFSGNLLNYPEGAFSQLFNYCIAPGFWINLMIFEPSYTIFGSFPGPWGSV